MAKGMLSMAEITRQIAMEIDWDTAMLPSVSKADGDRYAREALVIRDAAQRAEAPQPTVWGRGRYAIVRLVPNADQYYIYDIQTGVIKKSMTNFLDAEEYVQFLKKDDAQRAGLATTKPPAPTAPENYGGW